MRKVLYLLIVPGLAAGLFLASGCGGGDGDDDDNTTVVTNTVNNTTVVTNDVPTELPAPGLVSPASGTTFNHCPRSVTLVWAPVAGADKYVLERQYQSLGNWTSYPAVEVNATTYSFNFIGAQPGRWRVRAKTNSGTEGAWSDWSTFNFTI